MTKEKRRRWASPRSSTYPGSMTCEHTSRARGLWPPHSFFFSSLSPASTRADAKIKTERRIWKTRQDNLVHGFQTFFFFGHCQYCVYRLQCVWESLYINDSFLRTYIALSFLISLRKAFRQHVGFICSCFLIFRFRFLFDIWSLYLTSIKLQQTYSSRSTVKH